MWRFVEPAATQNDSLRAEPLIDHLPRDFAGRDNARLRSPSFLLPARFRSRHHAPSAMNRRPERRLRFLWRTRRALENHRVVAHRSADESTLSREGRRRALAHHDQLFAVVLLPPGEVVMIVNEVELVTAQYRDDFARHPFASALRDLPPKLH